MVDPLNPDDYPDEVLDELSDPNRFDEAWADAMEDTRTASKHERRINNMSDTTDDLDIYDEPLYDLYADRASSALNPFPSKERDDYWVNFSITDAPLGTFAGKWLVFCSPSQVDVIWQSICVAMIMGKLGPCAKASTASARDDVNADHVICVYTKDHRNTADVMRVRAGLREIGVTKKIPYKTNTSTIRGDHAKGGKKVSKFYE